jgi:hypothetical protein
MVGDVKTAPLEDNRRGMKDAPGSLLALRTFRLWLVLKALLHLKTVMAVAALVFINGHGKNTSPDSTTILLFYNTYSYEAN